MEPYLVSARKYRPSTFKSVVGQKALTTTLKNAVASGRLAHSYLFCGSRGVGKTSSARIFAKTINCERPTPDGEACNECESCRAFNEGVSLNIIELDAASNNGVDDIRELVKMTLNPPSSGKYKVFIVDEVHMLSGAAFNAFLKTLEEPPSYVVFILATTEKHKILPTILSRCQIYDFSRITIQDMIDHMTYVASQEGYQVESAALNVIARQADGAMRDALSIFDQVAASSMGNITYQSTIESLNVLDSSYYKRLLDSFLEGRVLEAWLIYNEIRDKGFDSHFLINGLASYFRDLMVASSPQTLHLIEAGDEARAEMAEAASKCHPQFIYRAMNLLNDADLHYREASNKQFLTELTLAKICQLCSPSPNNGSNGEGQELTAIIAPTQVSNQSKESGAHTASSGKETAPKSPTPKVGSDSPSQQGFTPTTFRPSRAQTVTAKNDKFSNLRINSRRPAETKNPEVGNPQKEPASLDRARNFTKEDFVKAWEAFANLHSKEHILINTMRAAIPVKREDGSYIMTVENEMQLETVRNAMPELLPYLRNALENDSITVSIEINEGQSSPAVWSEREVLEHMKQSIPDLNNFISTFKLKLG